jgi:hypothetical protein
VFSVLTLCLARETLLILHDYHLRRGLRKLSRFRWLRLRFLEVQAIPCEVLDFKMPFLFRFIINQVRSLLSLIIMCKTYILIGSIIIKSLDELSDGHVIGFLNLI